MANLVLDTLALTGRLEKAGFNRIQSECIVRTVAEAQTEMLTKTDLETALVPIKMDLEFMKRMIMVVLAAALAELIKSVIH
jgi:hypothetical protein